MNFDIKNYFKKFKLLFFKPSLFFKSEQKEISYWNILLFFVVFTFLLNALSMIVDLISGDFLSLGNLVFQTALSFGIPFVIVAYNHLFVMLFKGKNYLNSFKAIVYSDVVGVFYGLIFFILGLFFTRFLVNIPEGAGLIEVWETIRISSGFWVFAVLFVLVYLVQFIHIFYNRIVGISMYHGISKKNAFFAVLLAKIIIGVLIGLFILIMFFVMGTLFTTSGLLEQASPLVV